MKNILMIPVRFLWSIIGALIIMCVAPVCAFHDLFNELVLNKDPLEYETWLI